MHERCADQGGVHVCTLRMLIFYMQVIRLLILTTIQLTCRIIAVLTNMCRAGFAAGSKTAGKVVLAAPPSHPRAELLVCTCVPVRIWCRLPCLSLAVQTIDWPVACAQL